MSVFLNLVEERPHAHAGAEDEIVQSSELRGHRRYHFTALPGVGHVGGNNQAVGSASPDAAGRFLKRLLRAGSQSQVQALGGQIKSQSLPQP